MAITEYFGIHRDVVMPDTSKTGEEVRGVGRIRALSNPARIEIVKRLLSRLTDRARKLLEPMRAQA
jgi:hypothetical protein